MTQEELNAWSNGIFERCGDLDQRHAPDIETAIQALSEAADHLSSLTYDVGSHILETGNDGSRFKASSAAASAVKKKETTHSLTSA